MDTINKTCQSCSLSSSTNRFEYKKIKSNVDILFVLESPTIEAVREGLLYGEDNKGLQALNFLVQQAIRDHKAKIDGIYPNNNFSISYDYTYCVSCNLDEETSLNVKLKNGKPTTSLIHTCRDNLFKSISKANPKIIIPVGDVATKALYIFYKKFNGIVARTTKTKIGPNLYTVIPILTVENICKNDSLFSISQLGVTIAIENIFNEEFTPKHRQEIDISGYVIPKTIEEVKDICDLIIQETDSEDYKKNFLGVDIETNSKYSFRKDSKIIMISFAWGEGKSCAIWMDSKHTPYPFEEARPHIQRVLSSKAGKVFHNGQFDYKFLVYAYGFTVDNLKWDTLLGEHLIDENMKGFYNLEFLAGKYFPVYENYKKLVLKKISTKDKIQEFDRVSMLAEEDLSHEDFTSEESNFDYQREMLEYQDKLNEYTKSKSEYQVSLSIYKQNLQLWEHKVGKEDKVTKELKSEKPKKPKLEAKKPAKPDMSKLTNEDTKSNFEDYNPEDLQIYCAMDSDITKRMALRQIEKIKERKEGGLFQVMLKQIIPGIIALSDIEYRGANTDQEYLNKIEKELTLDHKKLYDTIIRMSGIDGFKPNSTKQIAHVIHSRYGIPLVKEYISKETGQVKTDKNALLHHVRTLLKPINPEIIEDEKKIYKFMETYREDNALGFISTLFSYRDATKTLNTTLGNFRKNTEYDGKLRSNFMQNGTRTRRLASSNLNLQNIPLESAGYNLKKFITPDTLDDVLVDVDIKTAEIRILLCYAKETELIDSIKNGMDMHSYVVSKIFLKKYPELTQEQLYSINLAAHKKKIRSTEEQTHEDLRDRAKKINFGLVYGITKYGLSRDLHISENEAQDIIDDYFKNFPRIKEYMDRTWRDLQKNRAVTSLTYGKRRFPRFEINRGGSFRQGINFPVQNVSSDLTARSLYYMHRNIKKELGERARIVLTVHDSILMNVPKESVPLLKEYLDKMIIHANNKHYPWLVLPFEYEYKIGDNYGEMAKV